MATTTDRNITRGKVRDNLDSLRNVMGRSGLEDARGLDFPNVKGIVRVETRPVAAAGCGWELHVLSHSRRYKGSALRF